MKKELLFDFNVNKEKKTVYITREFDAPLDLVWDAFTKKELLDQWVAPKPLTARTKYQDFKVGGKRCYAMVMPDGAERWALQTYTSITPKTNFKYYNTFCDKDENPEPVGSDWDHTFSETNGKTTVRIVIYNESFERLEKLLDGFTQGMRMSLENLDELFSNQSN
jgi:uncharacterized protein YndB with AHSA1/START domain